MPKAKNAKKKFIDKKKSVTFNLVHRSQRDPLVADETAPQRVLVPVNAVVPPRNDKDPELTLEQRKEEERKYGVYFDDEYNYLQHLKGTREVTLLLQPKPSQNRKSKGEDRQQEAEDFNVLTDALKLPSSVFASEVEEDVGLLNKAATQGLCLKLDPDVVAALDDDFDFEDPENQLEDEFVAIAGGDQLEGDSEGGDEESSDAEDEGGSGSDRSDQAFADSDDDSDSQQGGSKRDRRMPTWDKDDTKSRFSQYSMSSSVIRRNQGLSLLDDRFEKMYAEYDDTELGALDSEDIDGFLPEHDDLVQQAFEDFQRSQQKHYLDRAREMARMQHLQEIAEESSGEDDEVVAMEVTPKKKWDCESILSTYSNIYNHPKLIQEPKKPQKIRIDTKTGIPKDVLGADTRLTVKTLARFNALQDHDSSGDEDGRTRAETVLSTLSVLSIRPKDETQEEKKERKRLLKEYRKERRVEKKANQEAFKEEKKRQEKIMLNNRNNIQGNRLL